MIIKKTALPLSGFGNFTDIIAVHLACQDGFSVSLTSLGASIRQIKCPSSNGDLKNIALSFAEESAYLSNPLYAGATLAPTAGRISRGLLPLENRVYNLSKNENNRHNLHGGFQNASFQNWQLLSAEQKEDQAEISFGLTLPDGLDGFPGNRQLKAVYTLTEEHRLTLKYEAVSDQDTYFNLSNHCYFNLSGDFSHAATAQLLQIHADRYVCNAPDFIPEGTAAVEGTPFDFRHPKSLDQQLSAFPENIQLIRNQGYNHGFVLTHADQEPDLACALPDSSLQLFISSDAPCMVLYSGGYIEEGLKLADGQRSAASCALAFEFQDYPDAPGGHGFPYSITPAGKLWERTICYHFIFQSSQPQKSGNFTP